ncbi:unnamed protein product [Orchesella dallaii]|uniref:Uncharacterized protein n=1 Tax=Orchesella dallaii TaxID=48710 RepID=A0ABP1QQ13_9HEXA
MHRNSGGNKSHNKMQLLVNTSAICVTTTIAMPPLPPPVRISTCFFLLSVSAHFASGQPKNKAMIIKMMWLDLGFGCSYYCSNTFIRIYSTVSASGAILIK